MVIQNDRLTTLLNNILLESARYLLCNGDANADSLKGVLKLALDVTASNNKKGEKYILCYSMEDLLHYFNEASSLIKAEGEALKKSIQSANGME